VFRKGRQFLATSGIRGVTLIINIVVTKTQTESHNIIFTTSLTQPLFTEVPVPSPKIELSCEWVVRDSSVVRRHYIFLLEPSDVRAQYIRKTADLPHQLWVGTFPRFVAIGFY
jgi:hypothetical protein